jgi:tRNA/tmRNA/rRNA uracil-C5-methylase (TrmA/RlmC/RlmD family)
LPWAQIRHAAVDAAAVAGCGVEPDFVVLDPPRTGAGRAVTEAILALSPRAVSYVACDPAALARDVAIAVGNGWRLASLRAFDAFPMTAHVECVAVLAPA